MSDADDGALDAPGEVAISDIMRERVRQVVAENHFPHQDDALDFGELARMAASHALRATADLTPPGNPLKGVYEHRSAVLWPIARDALKDHDPRRRLVIAGALLVAEIERLDRLAANSSTATGDDPA